MSMISGMSKRIKKNVKKNVSASDILNWGNRINNLWNHKPEGAVIIVVDGKFYLSHISSIKAHKDGGIYLDEMNLIEMKNKLIDFVVERKEKRDEPTMENKIDGGAANDSRGV